MRESGERENFFSREKKFSLSPEPPLLFKKSGVFVEWGVLCRFNGPDGQNGQQTAEVTVHLVPLAVFLKRYLTKKFCSAILNKIFVASVQK